MPQTNPLPRPVRVLGLVSLLTDASSEMIYPLLPAFLTGVLRAGPATLGVIEGTAEATASLLKIVSGWFSDRTARRKPFVVAGYGLSTLARPVVALAVAPWHVFAVRLADRVGKGVRSAPRDALLAAVTPAEQRGRAFGFHRAMDHTGALIGPLLAFAALTLLTDDLRLVFAWALIPGLAAMIVLVFGVTERVAPHATDGAASTIAPSTTTGLGPVTGAQWRDLRRFFVVLALFTLGNSSDAFLLLRAQECGVPLAMIPLLWAFHHLVKAAFSTFGGALSDRVGRRAVIAVGWGVYALTYAGFSVSSKAWEVVLLFGVYGLYFALSEGPERALVADLAGPQARGRAFGLFHAVTGLMLLPASLLTGVLWQTCGAPVALGTGAGLALLAAVGLALLVPPAPPGREPKGRTSS